MAPVIPIGAHTGYDRPKPGLDGYGSLLEITPWENARVSPQRSKLPNWSLEGRLAVTVCDSAEYAEVRHLRTDFRSLWDTCRRSDEVAGVVVLLRGTTDDNECIAAADPDGDPTLGPLSCDMRKPVVLGLSGTIDAEYFPLFREISLVVASERTTLRCRDLQADRLPRAVDLPLPDPERARLTLLGSMSVQRAYEVGMVHQLCDPSTVERAAIAFANRGVID